MGEEAEGVKFDKWGYPVKTSSDHCISFINAYYDQVLSYGRKRSVIMEAQADDENCVLANILAAHFVFSTDQSQARLSSGCKVTLCKDEATAYEKAVFDAVSYLISEYKDDDVALELHSKLLKEFPKDLSSLKRAQLLCFYMGQPSLLLDLVQQVLPKNEGQSYIYGILSFALLELGRMEDAERAARKALEINKEDFWAQHCLCHVLQNECHFAEAVKFMEECSPSWSACSSFLYTNNWWHVAVCYLEGHAPAEKILDIYDNHIMKELEKSDAAHSEVYVNALGLFLRLHVRGEMSLFEDRLKTLAALLSNQAIWYVEWQLALLILWALASTDMISAAQELLEGLRSSGSKMNNKKKQLMQRALTLAEALYAYGRGDDAQAMQLFGTDFDANNCKMIGASDEQLDVFNEVWYSLLLNNGQPKKVVEVVDRRLKMREGVPFLWRLLEKAYLMLDKEEAARAAVKANFLEDAYFPR